MNHPTTARPEDPAPDRPARWRMFATWTRDDQGPMFCRWVEPAEEAPHRQD